jgi:predicted dinucleotide-binding enzyme
MTQILLVGCGNMGGALLAGWCRMGDASLQITVINRSKPELPSGMAYHSSIDALAADYAPDAIILAVKPQQLDDVLPGLRARFGKTSPLYISVAAGKTLAYFAQQLGSDNVVRAMPNTPSMIGKGITVMCAPTTLPQAARQLSHSLLAALRILSGSSTASPKQVFRPDSMKALHCSLLRKPSKALPCWSIKAVILPNNCAGMSPAPAALHRRHWLF